MRTPRAKPVTVTARRRLSIAQAELLVDDVVVGDQVVGGDVHEKPAVAPAVSNR